VKREQNTTGERLHRGTSRICEIKHIPGKRIDIHAWESGWESTLIMRQDSIETSLKSNGVPSPTRVSKSQHGGKIPASKPRCTRIQHYLSFLVYSVTYQVICYPKFNHP
jgi:hypothetical protein